MKANQNLLVSILALVSSILSAAIILTCALAPGTSQSNCAEAKPLPAAAAAEPTKAAPKPVAVQAVAATQPAAAPAQPKAAPAAQAAAKPAEKSDADAVMEAARKAVEKCTNSGMSREEKLKAAFAYLQKNYLEGVRRDLYREPDWPVVYAKDLLIKGKGDCFSYGAAFAYMAKAIGCEAYACNSGGHGWAEIDGKIYDPEWAMHSKNNTYFALSYDTPCDVQYKGAIGWADWTHVKV